MQIDNKYQILDKSSRAMNCLARKCGDNTNKAVIM